MVTIRCTKKLLARIGPPDSDPTPSTTVLGDWYAKPVAVGHQRYILLIAERSRMAVVMPARDAKHLARNFPEALSKVLVGLGIPPSIVEREVEATCRAVIATTDDRSLLGTLNDFAFMLWHRLQDQHAPNLLDAALWLSRSPVRPLHPAAFPDKVTRSLFGVTATPGRRRLGA